MNRDASHIPAATAGAYPQRSGNALRPLIDGEPAFRRICEAVEQARKSVWVTVAFIDQEFRMPNGRGSFFDLLDRAAARGVEVCALFWSEPEIERQIADAQHFAGNAKNIAFLTERNSGIQARWDRVADHCHHQKSWIIDAEQESEVAFVGGINLDLGSLVPPGHPADPDLAEGQGIHDAYLEIRGPAATDVCHNFVQRWNEASERNSALGCYPGVAAAFGESRDAPAAGPREGTRNLKHPRKLSPVAGDVRAQITRSVLPKLYRDTTPAPDAQSFAVWEGETSVLEQYLAAIDHATSSIYFENQLLLCPKIITQLRAALERGIEVVVLVPNRTMPEVVAAREHPRAKPLFDLLGSLGDFANFTFAALATNRIATNRIATSRTATNRTATNRTATNRTDGGGTGAGGGATALRYEDIYVHAKLAIVDDCWVTIGSANTMWRSFRGDTELNASFWSSELAKALRCELLREHLLQDSSELSDREAFALYRSIALANSERRRRGEEMLGQVFAIEPSRWAT
jgi:cardiolipin synthase